MPSWDGNSMTTGAPPLLQKVRRSAMSKGWSLDFFYLLDGQTPTNSPPSSPFLFSPYAQMPTWDKVQRPPYFPSPLNSRGNPPGPLSFFFLPAAGGSQQSRVPSSFPPPLLELFALASKRTSRLRTYPLLSLAATWPKPLPRTLPTFPSPPLATTTKTPIENPLGGTHKPPRRNTRFLPPPPIKTIPNLPRSPPLPPLPSPPHKIGT